MLISSYIPSGVVSTSETSTVSEELFVAGGKKNTQLLYIDIGSKNQFFAVKRLISWLLCDIMTPLAVFPGTFQF